MWAVELSRHPTTMAAIDGYGNIYVGDPTGTVYAMEARQGIRFWSVYLGDNVVVHPPLLTETHLIVTWGTGSLATYYVQVTPVDSPSWWNENKTAVIATVSGFVFFLFVACGTVLAVWFFLRKTTQNHLQAKKQREHRKRKQAREGQGNQQQQPATATTPAPTTTPRKLGVWRGWTPEGDDNPTVPIPDAGESEKKRVQGLKPGPSNEENEDDERTSLLRIN